MDETGPASVYKTTLTKAEVKTKKTECKKNYHLVYLQVSVDNALLVTVLHC